MFQNGNVFCRRYRRMQQQSLFERSNVYWRCQLVHLCLCRWLHRNALRDRFVFDDKVNCSPYAAHLNNSSVFNSLSGNYLLQAGLTTKRATHFHTVLNYVIWMQISTNAAAILVWMEQHVLTLWILIRVAVSLVTPEHTARQVHRQRQFFTHAPALGWLRTYFSMGQLLLLHSYDATLHTTINAIFLRRRNVKETTQIYVIRRCKSSVATASHIPLKFEGV